MNHDEMVKRSEGFADVKSTLENKAELRSRALVYIESTLISRESTDFSSLIHHGAVLKLM